jgi:hypothetical protein
LCAIYDAILNALYTSVKSADIETYKKLVEQAIDLSKQLTEQLYEWIAYCTEDTQAVFNDDVYDITTALDKLLSTGTVAEEVGEGEAFYGGQAESYMYQVNEGTEVVIDDIAVPVLQELNANHKKEYVSILEQWLARIGKQKELAALKNSFTTALSSDAVQEQLEKLAKLQDEGILSTEEREFLLEKRDQLEGVRTQEKTKKPELEQLLNALNTEIKKAKANFAKSIITYVPIKLRYENIQKILTEVPSLKIEFDPKVTEMRDAYVQYLGMVCAPTDTLSQLPVTVYEIVPNQSVDATFVKRLGDASKMLQELKELRLLGIDSAQEDTNKELKQLHIVLMQGYGYLLAAFDALNARIIDTITSIQKGVWSFFSYVGGTNMDSLYAQSQYIVNTAMPAIQKLRTDYYTTFIAPYFVSGANANNQNLAYLAGNLNLMTLNLQGIATADGTYTYKREPAIMGEIRTVFSDVPTGLHRRYIGLNAGITHGGDQQYEEIRTSLKQVVESIFKEAMVKQQQKDVADTLAAILQVPLNNRTLATIHQKDDEHGFPLYTLLAKKSGAATLKTYLLTITQQLEEKRLYSNIQALAKADMLTPEIRDTITHICAYSFGLYDGLCAWIFHYYANKQQQSLMLKVLSQCKTPLEQLFKILQQFYVPYMRQDTYSEYQQSGFNIQEFVGTAGTAYVQRYQYFIGQTSMVLVSGKTNPQVKQLPKGPVLLLINGLHTKQTPYATILSNLLTGLGGDLVTVNKAAIQEKLEPLGRLQDINSVSVAEIEDLDHIMARNLQDVVMILKSYKNTPIPEPITALLDGYVMKLINAYGEVQ